MKHGSLFSGIGGFDLAAEWMGWENIFHCEIGEYPQRLLKQNFKNSTSYADIIKTDFTIYRGLLDVLSGGFPCQPFSLAGDQLGEADERFLFKEMLRTARETETPWIVGENVFGITAPKFRNTFNEICASLEAEGYKVQPIIIPASVVGAWHERYRTFFIAYSDSFGRKRRENGRNSEDRKRKNYTEIQSKRCYKPDWESENRAGFESRFIRVVDGIPQKLDVGDRTARLKGCGNAIVPQVAFEIFKTIEMYEKIERQ